MDHEAVGSSELFVDGGPLKRSQYIHSVTLRDLKLDTQYEYHAGSKYAWSEKFSFRTFSEDGPVRAAIYGDLGNANAQSLPYLQDEAERNYYDLILHVGDFAYNMDDNDALVGDEFMRQIQPIAAIVPYMTCPGNHERAYNFSNYAARFSMPGRDSSLFYSFDVDPVHFISISTEVYHSRELNEELISSQYDWVKNDLQRANLPENRSKRPWIILFGHRPMYCSNILSDCDSESTRFGIDGKWALEPFLKDYGVDLVIWAHEHSYERTYPLYDGEVHKGSEEQPYVNPGAPVHIITGSAGCKEEHHKPFNSSHADWSVFRSLDYGYTRFIAYNKSHIYMEQVDVDLELEVIDSFWLIKDEHKAYEF
ncbi:acid phosphatase type 7 [Helicoverpa armigera]|uniref:acid phosphatase type 7 n=1 Tax=Helicoverpa armigera TaxID=29058 RepID=UPI003082E407